MLYEDIQRIRAVFAADSKIKEVLLFGSRAKGNYKTGSDIDLAIVADNYTFDDLVEVDTKRSAIGLLYKFDLINFNRNHDQKVADHIRRVGLIFFKR